jgi:hypothetical protein
MMPKPIPPDNGLILRSKGLRARLCKELPELPSDVAQGLDTLHLSMLCAVWLNSDERLAARDFDHGQ